MYLVPILKTQIPDIRNIKGSKALFFVINTNEKIKNWTTTKRKDIIFLKDTSLSITDSIDNIKLIIIIDKARELKRLLFLINSITPEYIRINASIVVKNEK